MILKASQRSGAKQLGLHLLKIEENEHVEIHEVSGFISDNVMGAMNEAYGDHSVQKTCTSSWAVSMVSTSPLISMSRAIFCQSM